MSFARLDVKSPRNGASLRRQFTSENGELNAQQLVLLDTACAALDQALAAEKLVRKAGLVVEGARGPKPHPAITIAQAARGRMMRALKALAGA
jgi:phage terminase small subunit